MTQNDFRSLLSLATSSYRFDRCFMVIAAKRIVRYLRFVLKPLSS